MTTLITWLNTLATLVFFVAPNFVLAIGESGSLPWLDCIENPTFPSYCKRSQDITFSNDIPLPNKTRLGPFEISLVNKQKPQILIKGYDGQNEYTVFSTIPGQSFLAVGKGKAHFTENRGSFVLDDDLHSYCSAQVVEDIKILGDRILIEGRFTARGSNADLCNVGYSVSLILQGTQQLDFKARLINKSKVNTYNRIYLNLAAPKDEQYFGFGMQFSFANMKNRRVPILTQEQGVGRGVQPLSIGAEITNGKGVSGSWHSSYGSVPQFISSHNRSFFLKNSEYSVFDFTKESTIHIELFSPQFNGSWIIGASPKKILEHYTQYSGRMKPLPQWADQGLIIGMQGGTEKVRSALSSAKENQIPVAAFWLQDWVGKRKTSFGSQLWWNWGLDHDHYPQWSSLINDLAAEDIQVMTYINPFLVDLEERKNWQGRQLLKEAQAQDLLVKNEKGDYYPIQNTSFHAGLLDISQEKSRNWIKKVIKEEVLASGAKGWMADFGEALPMDSILANADAMTYHNQYPVEWAKINREIIMEESLDDDILFFSRSAFTQSPKYSRLFWLGDQLVSWDEHDGIKTAVTGLISSGLSGFSLNHSDIGGYTTITNPLVNYHRSEELFQRWTELNAFTAVMRTHEGNIPSANHQFDNSPSTLKHMAKFSRIFKLMRPYRRNLMNEAYLTGLPLVRHMFLEFPEDPMTYNLRYQFMLGSHVLVAPVLDQGEDEVDVYIPSGDWQHLWTGKDMTKGHHRVKASMGNPAIYFKKGHQSLKNMAVKIRKTESH